MKRLKHDKRAVSNAIVVMLSLVLVVIIVANVVLWSYQMNQLDWEKMQEDVKITDVARAGEAWSYNPSGYAPSGSTSLVSGSVSNLTSNDGVYMVFRSYATATSNRTLYAHQETTTIGGATYYLQKLDSADASGTTLSVSGATTGRKSTGKFVYQLKGSSSIPASTWTIYYRAIKDTVMVAHCDVDIRIRRADGGIRETIATDVANSGSIPTAWSTLSGTYVWSVYTVVDQTDYLEIEYYIEVTTASAAKTASLRIDDSTLPLSDQTRVTNIMLPSEYAVEVEFTGTSNTEDWTQLIWTVDSAWTISSVNVTLQLFNYTLGDYPTSENGYIAYTSGDTPNTDETKNQTITVNPTDFRNATGYWRMKIKGVKATDTQFDFKVDWTEFKVVTDSGTLFTFENAGSLTSHVVSLWIINSTNHRRYDANLFINSGEEATYIRADIRLPSTPFIAKVVTERGNMAVFARS